ncbi:TetR/AcrR family transcriptional regulator [Modestobacter sp. Leaf380]|uniref:TetR/AcrR family transcriptional regulator n=1 Tax=Modestobacter sp. Leaf380 TaxID=1736356 RepID=UPI0006FFDF8E|nr:TetR/AcrR family transcriptional regulator [Modestobacter sp. Leaf380]KQS65727.1 hypothetical protein ASG41_14095 [Modestobacter sp. Leaf380]
MLAARRLFHEQGFAATTVEQVARAADVATATVYAHAATKEELFFLDRLPAVLSPETLRPDHDGGPWDEALVARLVAAQESDLRSLVDPDCRQVAREIEATQALLRHERTLFARAEVVLAGVIGERTPAVPAALLAALLMTTLRVQGHDGRRRLLAGTAGPADVDALVADLPHLLSTALALGSQDPAPADRDDRVGAHEQRRAELHQEVGRLHDRAAALAARAADACRRAAENGAAARESRTRAQAARVERRRRWPGR